MSYLAADALLEILNHSLVWRVPDTRELVLTELPLLAHKHLDK
jgi:hypothetical protein